MDIIKVILLALLLPFAAFALLIFLAAFAISDFIDDIYDDDIYWGGKE